MMKTQQVFKNSKAFHDVVVLLHARPTRMVYLLNKREENKRIPKRRKLFVFILSLDIPMCQLHPIMTHGNPLTFGHVAVKWTYL
jgi:hypothetical protein